MEIKTVPCLLCAVCSVVVEIAWQMKLHTVTKSLLTACCVKVLGDEVDQEIAKILLSVHRI